MVEATTGLGKQSPMFNKKKLDNVLCCLKTSIDVVRKSILPNLKG